MQPKSSRFDFNLGAYELVDVGVTPEVLLAQEVPILFHKTFPVHSVHQTTVQTECALENLLTAPESMLSNRLPPTVVDDNYCFVIDAEKVNVDQLMKDEMWWKPTGRPVQYFYSKDLRTFQRVNCIKAKGTIIAAKISAAKPQTFSSSGRSSAALSERSTPLLTPRSSFSMTSEACSRAGLRMRDEQVPLEDVYVVTRFYSFWKSCPSFHRIVTTFDHARNSRKVRSSKLKKRVFVQYIWQNTKASDKERVKREFDLSREKLLRSAHTETAHQSALDQ